MIFCKYEDSIQPPENCPACLRAEIARKDDALKAVYDFSCRIYTNADHEFREKHLGEVLDKVRLALKDDPSWLQRKMAEAKFQHERSFSKGVDYQLRAADLQKVLLDIRDKWLPAMLRDSREADKVHCVAQSIHSLIVHAIPECEYHKEISND